jgi:hypothetical protein
VTEDQPTAVHVLLPAFARWVGAPEPLRVPLSGELDPDSVYYATRLRGAETTCVEVSCACSCRTKYPGTYS